MTVIDKDGHGSVLGSRHQSSYGFLKNEGERSRRELGL